MFAIHLRDALPHHHLVKSYASSEDPAEFQRSGTFPQRLQPQAKLTVALAFRAWTKSPGARGQI